jgi:restriction endonuclease S subunit
MNNIKMLPLARFVAKIKDGTHGTHNRTDEGVPLLSAKNVFNGRLTLSEEESLVSESEAAVITANGFPAKNDILLTTVGTIGRSLVWSKTHSLPFQRSVSFLRLNKIHNPYYFAYYFQTRYFQEQLALLTKTSAQPGIYMGEVMKVPAPLIEKSSQDAAVKFLDKKTATIDKMIAAKNHTRTHLAELRTAIITKAVLGQGSSNNLQQTNIPWIGEVPAHWTVRKLKDLATISIGWTPSTSNPEYFEGDNIWVTIADMNKKHISESKNRVSDVAIIDAGIKKVPKGSLLYSFKLSVGKVAFAGTDLYTNEAIAAIIPRSLKQIDNKFLYYALSTYLIDSANENIYGAKLLNQSLIKNAYIALPPIDEQKQIATELNRKLTKLDRTMVKTTNSLELLKEYRSSLISNVITGKVAV